MRLGMGGRGPWRGPSARSAPCRLANQSRITAFFMLGVHDAEGDIVSLNSHVPMRRADMQAVRTDRPDGGLTQAYPQSRHAAVYERGRIDG